LVRVVRNVGRRGCVTVRLPSSVGISGIVPAVGVMMCIRPAASGVARIGRFARAIGVVSVGRLGMIGGTFRSEIVG
jgi:hypothetical protein